MGTDYFIDHCATEGPCPVPIADDGLQIETLKQFYAVMTDLASIRRELVIRFLNEPVCCHTSTDDNDVAELCLGSLVDLQAEQWGAQLRHIHKAIRAVQQRGTLRIDSTSPPIAVDVHYEVCELGRDLRLIDEGLHRTLYGVVKDECEDEWAARSIDPFATDSPELLLPREQQSDSPFTDAVTALADFILSALHDAGDRAPPPHPAPNVTVAAASGRTPNTIVIAPVVKHIHRPVPHNGTAAVPPRPRGRRRTGSPSTPPTHEAGDALTTSQQRGEPPQRFQSGQPHEPQQQQQRVGMLVWVTDRDGTINNYCGRYMSSTQAAYNAICCARFAAICCSRSIVLTSAPLTSPGYVDVSVVPRGLFAVAKGPHPSCPPHRHRHAHGDRAGAVGAAASGSAGGGGGGAGRAVGSGGAHGAVAVATHITAAGSMGREYLDKDGAVRRKGMSRGEATVLRMCAEGVGYLIRGSGGGAGRDGGDGCAAGGGGGGVNGGGGVGGGVGGGGGGNGGGGGRRNGDVDAALSVCSSTSSSSGSHAAVTAYERALSSAARAVMTDVLRDLCIPLPYGSTTHTPPFLHPSSPGTPLPLTPPGGHAAERAAQGAASSVGGGSVHGTASNGPLRSPSAASATTVAVTATSLASADGTRLEGEERGEDGALASIASPTPIRTPTAAPPLYPAAPSPFSSPAGAPASTVPTSPDASTAAVDAPRGSPARPPVSPTSPFEKFGIIGSGLQLKFAQVTVARQDTTRSVDPSESSEWLAVVERFAGRVACDPEGGVWALRRLPQGAAAARSAAPRAAAGGGADGADAAGGAGGADTGGVGSVSGAGGADSGPAAAAVWVRVVPPPPPSMDTRSPLSPTADDAVSSVVVAAVAAAAAGRDASGAAAGFDAAAPGAHGDGGWYVLRVHDTGLDVEVVAARTSALPALTHPHAAGAGGRARSVGEASDSCTHAVPLREGSAGRRSGAEGEAPGSLSESAAVAPLQHGGGRDSSSGATATAAATAPDAGAQEAGRLVGQRVGMEAVHRVDTQAIACMRAAPPGGAAGAAEHAAGSAGGSHRAHGGHNHGLAGVGVTSPVSPVPVAAASTAPSSRLRHTATVASAFFSPVFATTSVDAHPSGAGAGADVGFDAAGGQPRRGSAFDAALARDIATGRGAAADGAPNSGDSADGGYEADVAADKAIYGGIQSHVPLLADPRTSGKFPQGGGRPRSSGSGGPPRSNEAGAVVETREDMTEEGGGSAAVGCAGGVWDSVAGATAEAGTEGRGSGGGDGRGSVDGEEDDAPRPEGVGWDKGRGLEWLMRSIKEPLSGRVVLVCGDTMSDVAMVEGAVRGGAVVYAVFVTTNRDLMKKVRRSIVTYTYHFLPRYHNRFEPHVPTAILYRHPTC